MPPPSFADDPILDFADDQERPSAAAPPSAPEEEAFPWPVKSGDKKKSEKKSGSRKHVADSPPNFEEAEAAAPTGQAELTFAPAASSPPRSSLPARPPVDLEPEQDDTDPAELFAFQPSLRHHKQETSALPERSILDSDDYPPEAELARPERELLPPLFSPPSHATRSPRLAQARPIPSSPATSAQYPAYQSSGPQHYNPPAQRNNFAPPQKQQQRKPSFNTTTTTNNKHHTQVPSPSRFIEAPPPHMPQAHFFGLPDLLDLTGKKASTKDGGKPAGSEGYCCTFDTLSESGDAVSSKKGKDVLLVGSEGGVDVYRILPNKLEVVGHLEGLRGSVIDARILPHLEVCDALQGSRPMIALVVHGPTDESRSRGDSDGEDDGDRDVLGHYQTTVEVYSLRTQRHVARLYGSPLVAVKNPSIGQLTSLPAPIGDLSISAKGKFIVVASGKSGEVFVLSAAANTLHSDEPVFRCIGKYWTSLQAPTDLSRPSNSRDGGVQSADESSVRPTVPLLSLSQRWLALVWPSSAQNSSILGSPLLSEQNANPVGLASHVAPSPPPFTCDVAGVDEEGTWGRLTRQAAQGIVKYSQRGIEMGWQGWKELTNPTPQSAQTQQHGRTSSKEHEQFPPTKALPEDASRRTIQEPAVVSIIDLEVLLEAEELKAKHPPLPLATFALTEGCNYLSLSSNGLRMLAVSRNGEVSTIWDLTQSCHGIVRYGSVEVDSLGPCVKQILRIPRSSQAVVVDAAWSRDDDSLALLTTHGTVHLHEIPSRAASKKRRRQQRRRSTSASTAIPDNTNQTAQTAAESPSNSAASPASGSTFFNTLKSSWQQVSTGVTTIRSQNPVSTLGIPTSFAGFKEATASAGQAGSRLVAKSLSQGLSAAKGGASDYWHAEDNKIRHRALSERVQPGAMRWVRRPSGTFFAVVCGGNVFLYSVVRLTRRKGDELVSGLKHEKGAKSFALQSIRTRDEARERERKGEECARLGPHGFWTLRSLGVDEHFQQPSSRRAGASEFGSAAAAQMKLHPHQQQPPSTTQNDVETNPPYCPFHVDSRVNIFAFDPDAGDLSLHGHGNNDGSNWIFGRALPSSTKMNSHDDSADALRFLSSARGGDGLPPGLRDSDDDEDGLAAQVESRLTVLTSTTTGGGAGGAGSDEGGSGGTRSFVGAFGGEFGTGVGADGVVREEEIRVHTRPAARRIEVDDFDVDDEGGVYRELDVDQNEEGFESY